MLGLGVIVAFWICIQIAINKEKKAMKKGHTEEIRWVECRTQTVYRNVKRMPPK